MVLNTYMYAQIATSYNMLICIFTYRILCHDARHYVQLIVLVSEIDSRHNMDIEIFWNAPALDHVLLANDGSGLFCE